MFLRPAHRVGHVRDTAGHESQAHWLNAILRCPTLRSSLMKKTICISVSEDMYEFIRLRVRDGYFYSVSEYLRSLVQKDEASFVLPPRLDEFEMPKPVNAIWETATEE